MSSNSRPVKYRRLLDLPVEILTDILVLVGATPPIDTASPVNDQYPSNRESSTEEMGQVWQLDVHSLLAASTTCRRLHSAIYGDKSGVWKGIGMTAYDDPVKACAFFEPRQDHPNEDIINWTLTKEGLKPRPVNWQHDVLRRALTIEIMLHSRRDLGEGSDRQLDLLRAKRAMITETVYGLFLDMPGYPSESRNAALLKQILCSPEFGYLTKIAQPERTAEMFSMLKVLRLVQDPEAVLWEEDAASELAPPWAKLSDIPNFHDSGIEDVLSPYSQRGRVNWKEIEAMVNIIMWQFRYAPEGALRVDENILDRHLATTLSGCGVLSDADWAGVSGSWYTVDVPFLEWGPNVITASLGTFSVAPCELDDIVEGFQQYRGRRMDRDSDLLPMIMAPPLPFSHARKSLFFCGLNNSSNLGGEVFVRGIVRLSADNPPVACWTWIIDRGQVGERYTIRVAQLPGRANAFFGRYYSSYMVLQEFYSREGAIWMMKV